MSTAALASASTFSTLPKDFGERCGYCRSTGTAVVHGAGGDALEDVVVVSPLAGTILSIDEEAPNAVGRFVNAIEQDPKLTTRVLSLANSAALSQGRPALEGVRDAVLRLGLQTVRATCLALLATRGLKPHPDLNMPGMWAHALLVAKGARELANLTRVDIATAAAYTAGLLHDFGYLVLAAKVPQQISCLAKRMATNPAERSMKTEAQCLLLTHDKAAAAVARANRLPHAIAQAIEFHHYPEQAPREARALALCVAIADRLVNGIDGGLENPGFYEPVTAIPDKWLAEVRLKQEQLQTVNELLHENFRAVGHLANEISRG